MIDERENGGRMIGAAHEPRRGPTGSERRPVVITGAAVGLPGGDRIFGPGNIRRLLTGQQMIRQIRDELRQRIVDKNIIRRIKSDHDGPSWERIDTVDDSIKLAGQAGRLDLSEEYGVPAGRVAALDTTTQMAIASGLEALHDAGLPVVLRYKAGTGEELVADRWGLPGAMQDDTGVIFASAFPGYDSFAGHVRRHEADRGGRAALQTLTELRSQITDANPIAVELDRRIAKLQAEVERDAYRFDSKFLFQVLSMGHSQFAELIGARGPNAQINVACGSTAAAVSIAEDWINTGRCRRVCLISADNASSENLLEWVGAGFLIVGAAATEEAVEQAALPFDRRRHGMVLGMGAAAIILESAEAAAERGIAPICDVLSTICGNSAYHGSRVDGGHLKQMMHKLVSQAEERWGVDRHEIAAKTLFVAHEPYTPARGGSAAAEVGSLAFAFGPSSGSILLTNTKGFTGHAMGAGIEDVLAIKSLETGLVPPVANFKEPDPALGSLRLSPGGSYPVEYALRLGAGFGSQVSMSLIRRVVPPSGTRPPIEDLGYRYRIADPATWQGWLNRMAGYTGAELEVYKRTLRIRDQGPPRVTPGP